jgi:hypothetical protein
MVADPFSSGEPSMGIGVDPEQDMSEDRRARLVITGRTLFSARQARRVLGQVVPRSRTRSTEFKSVFTLDADGDRRSLTEAVALPIRHRHRRSAWGSPILAPRLPHAQLDALRSAVEDRH